VSCRAAGGWLLASFQHDVSRMLIAISFLLVVVVVVVIVDVAVVVVVVVVPVVLTASCWLRTIINGLTRR
jgi:hypothetical protein